MEGVETISKTLAISTFCLLGTLLVVYQNRDGLRELLGSIAVPSQDQSSTLQTIDFVRKLMKESNLTRKREILDYSDVRSPPWKTTKIRHPMVQEFMELANVEPNLTQTPIKECKELCFLDYQCYARNASLWYPSKCYPWHHWDRWNALGGFFSKVFVASSRGREEPFIIYIAKDDKRLQSNKSIQNLVGVFSSNPVLVISCNSPQKKGWLLDRLANQRNSFSAFIYVHEFPPLWGRNSEPFSYGYEKNVTIPNLLSSHPNLTIWNAGQLVHQMYRLICQSFHYSTSLMSWQKQAKLENDALIIPTQYDVNLVRNVTNHWMCHNRAHPGYIVIDHMAHQLLNHLCQK